MKFLFWINALIIIWAMIGYKYSLALIHHVKHPKKIQKNYNYLPDVSIVIVAHNEEKIIGEKLENIIDNDYPKEKIDYFIASDFSTDHTDDIVRTFIKKHPEINMKLCCTKVHAGKTNAQNEVQKFANGEILIMTDANSLFQPNSVRELVACFVDDNIAYVAGQLKFCNVNIKQTPKMENTYWRGDLKQREMESNIWTITAGNGAIYAVRNSLYYDFPSIKCHDSAMPYLYGLQGKRCLYNPDAIAYEKAGETEADEFKRKVRMSRNVITEIPERIRALNPIGHAWFSYFYFGHRTCRYTLWLAHIFVFFAPIIICFQQVNVFYIIVFAGQVLFYVISALAYILHSKNRLFSMMFYYSMTIFAQLCGVINTFTGKTKPTWEKAESTR